MAKREAEWLQKRASRAELEQRLTAYALEEAISSFADEHADLTDKEAIAALQAVQDAVEREIMAGVHHEPQGEGRVKALAMRILRNASAMRQRLDVPSNVLLARVARLLTRRALYLSERSPDGKGYLRAVKIDAPPHSLGRFLERLTSSVQTR